MESVNTIQIQNSCWLACFPPCYWYLSFVCRAELRCCCCCVAQAGEARSFGELENELLKGQKLQGVLTSDEVQVGCRALIFI
jgi:hypothetical protein